MPIRPMSPQHAAHDAGASTSHATAWPAPMGDRFELSAGRTSPALILSYASAVTQPGADPSRPCPPEASLRTSAPQAQRIAMAHFTHASIIDVSPIADGYSGNAVMRLDVDGRPYVLKMLGPHSDAAARALMTSEIKLALWAAEHDLGPAMMAYDAEAGYFISDFIYAEYTDWSDASHEPKLSAMLGVTQTIHHLTAHDAWRRVAVCTDRIETEAEAGELTVDERRDVRIKQALDVIEQSNDRMQGAWYQAVRLHGDMHPFNALFTGGKVYVIDWEESHIGDAMFELSAIADQLGFDAIDLSRLMALYGSDAADDLRRLEEYFLQRIARRVVQAFVGMPWDATKNKEDHKAQTFSRLERTLAHLTLH